MSDEQLTHPFDGLSLKYAYRPTTETQLECLSQDHMCLACGDSGNYITGDLGPKKRLGDMQYFRGALKCECGFMNFAYVALNNIKRRQFNVSVADALLQLDLQGELPNYLVEEWLQMSAACAHKEDYDQAEQFIYRCLEVEPDSQAALYNLGWLCTKRKQIEQAVSAYHKVEQIGEGFPSASLNLGYIYQEAGDYQRAASAYRRFLNQFPNHMDARSRLSQCDKKLTG